MNLRLHQSKVFVLKQSKKTNTGLPGKQVLQRHTGVQQFEILRKKVENVAADNPTRV
jgi:hypothetical protein